MSSQSAVSERGIIYLALILIYLLFAISAYMRAPSLWGINFLYYLPTWQKLCFIIAGGIILIPPINALLFKCITSLFGFQFAQMGLGSKILLLFLASLVIVSFLYILRVTPIYHDSLNAIYFINRDVSFTDYVTQTAYGINKPLLCGFNAFLRFILKTKLGLSPFETLFYASIFLGLVYIALTIGIANLFDFQSFQKAFLVILLITQAISLYYFGYGNFYAIVPITALSYLYCLVFYFRAGISVFVPIAAGIIAIGVHAGLIFILPSMFFIVIHRLKRHLTFLYALFSFSSPRRSILIFTLLLFGGYVILKSGAIPLLHVQNALVSFATDPELKYGYKILSAGYFVHLINVLLLISPVGMILFFVLIKNIHAVKFLGELKYALLWMGLGGMAMIVFLSPQTLYAWDIYGWMCAATVLLGSLLYAFYSQQLTRYSHLTTVLLVHSSIYFLAWICMNSNVYAAIMNYLDSVPAAFKIQISICIEATNLADMDPASYSKLLKILEKKATSKEDYSAILSGYGKIGDSQNYNRLYEKYLQLLWEAIREDPDNAYNYYQYTKTFSDEEKKDPRNRAAMEPYYLKAIELEPSSINYRTLYAVFLVDTGDKEKAYSVFRKIDSLYTSQSVSLLETIFPHTKIKIDLTCLSFIQHDNLETIRYFNEALALGAGFGEKNFELAAISCLGAYANMGNLGKAKELLAFAHDHNAAMNYDDAIVSKETAKGKEYGLSRLKDYLNAGNFMDLRKILEFMTENNPDPDFEIFWCPVYLWNEQYQELFNKASEILRHDQGYPYAHIFIGIGYLASQKNDSAMTAFDLETKMVPDSAYEEQALESTTIVQYLSQYVDDARFSDSLRQSLRSAISHANH